MPLYEVKDKHGKPAERVRTVARSREDRRLAKASNATLVDEAKPTPATAPPDSKALKDEWIAHAIDQGMPSYEAHAATKDELIERYGG